MGKMGAKSEKFLGNRLGIVRFCSADNPLKISIESSVIRPVNEFKMGNSGRIRSGIGLKRLLSARFFACLSVSLNGVYMQESFIVWDIRTMCSSATRGIGSGTNGRTTYYILAELED